MLTIEKVKQHYDVHELETPAMIVDNSVISQKFLEFCGMIDGVRVFYSVKANSHKVVLRNIRDLGSGFEVSSTKELRAVVSLGVGPDRIVVGNTMKVPSFIERCHEYGVNYFAYDSQNEIDKLADLAPRSNVALRISVDNSGSEWPLSMRFGVSRPEAERLLAYAKKKRLNPYGITFHVGSQCTDATAWSKALVTVAELLKWASDNNLNLEVV
ncbi:MAG: alanine racemase, partial [Deltaproteobacteria bacterium]